ncbi:hypothetical protein ABH994_005457 [Bradyrhizobium yuanmingense]|uniref:Uncharacterized protein n=1 Tax=Bradyrhizobium yuanmingense TaxID=108015 RepID=A0ABV4GMK6_9BRAD|nr:hypothetical protein [Bradyrhizobium yuanmingense]
MPTLKKLAAKLGFELLARSAVIPMAIAQRRSSRRGLAIDGDGLHTHPDQLYISSKLGDRGHALDTPPARSPDRSSKASATSFPLRAALNACDTSPSGALFGQHELGHVLIGPQKGA